MGPQFGRSLFKQLPNLGLVGPDQETIQLLNNVFVFITSDSSFRFGRNAPPPLESLVSWPQSLRHDLAPCCNFLSNSKEKIPSNVPILRYVIL